MKNYHIITIGCQMNKSDSERIAAYLNELGYAPVEDRSRAALIVLVTCGVRQAAEDRVYGLIGRIKKESPGARLLLTGCLSERPDVIKRLQEQVDIWLPVRHLPELAERLGEQISICSYKDYLSIQPAYTGQFSAFVPIGNGCDNFCAYCVVPHARGREIYRPADDIRAEVEKLVSAGCKEVVLIAQNVNSYRFPVAELANQDYFSLLPGREWVDFPMLLRAINDIKGDFWIRFATSHPKDVSGDLIEAIAAGKKVCRHIHLPAQAGDDDVLRRMNRNYSRRHYLRLLGKIRQALDASRSQADSDSSENDSKKSDMAVLSRQKNYWRPPVAITTDIIVGFPGETRQQFKNTLALFRDAKFDMAYVARYSPRPGTAAEKLPDDVDQKEKKEREEILMDILRQTAYENNQRYIGRIVRVLVEKADVGKNMIGRTETGKVVKIKDTELRDEGLVGRFLPVKIQAAEDFGLTGRICNI